MLTGRGVLPVAAFLAWTLLVWGGRIRNALADTALDGSERARTLALAASFVVPAVWLAGEWVLAVSRRRTRPRRAAWGLSALAAWTVAVWMVRAGDIALAGDHDIGFVVVHVALAGVSSALAAAAVIADRRAGAASGGGSSAAVSGSTRTP